MNLRKILAHLRNIGQAVSEELHDIHVFTGTQARTVWMEVSSVGPTWLELQRTRLSVVKGSHTNTRYDLRICGKLKLGFCWINPIKPTKGDTQ